MDLLAQKVPVGEGSVQSLQGRLSISGGSFFLGNGPYRFEAVHQRYENDANWTVWAKSNPPYWDYHTTQSRDTFWLTVPTWFVTTAMCTFASVVWLPFRFSVRTLLLATTLVAVVLGLIMWAAR
jgi:hypothetical protein